MALVKEPTCVYYEHLPCERMKECPVHGPLLRRPFKKRHYLRREFEHHPWNTHLAPMPRTFCGLMLHPRQILEEEVQKILAVPTFEPCLLENRRWMAAYSHFTLNNPTWKQLPIRLEGQDPNVQIYYELGWDRREILVVEKKADCKQCRASRRYGLPAPLDRREDPKRKPYRTRDGRGEGSEEEPKGRHDQCKQDIPHR